MVRPDERPITKIAPCSHAETESSRNLAARTYQTLQLTNAF
jgi:hypothetical protein